MDNILQFSDTIKEIPIIDNLIIFDEIDSTNNYAKSLGEEAIPGTLIVSDSQTGGRGRNGRSFASPSGEGIYMSLMIRPRMSTDHISGITLLSAMAIHLALKHYHGIKTDIKWPNDVLINGRKISGILTEYANGFIILGIGINVNNKHFDTDISEVATSIFIEEGTLLKREALIEEIFREFNKLYDEFMATESLKFITDAYNEALISYKKGICIIPHELTNALSNTYNINATKDKSLEVLLCMGIAPDGSLICRHDDGRLELVSSGEVSVRHSF